MGTSMIQRHEQGHSRTLFQSEEEPRCAPQGEGSGLISEVHPGGLQWFSPMHSPTGKYRTQTFRPAVALSTIEKIIIRKCYSCQKSWKTNKHNNRYLFPEVNFKIYMLFAGWEVRIG